MRRLLVRASIAALVTVTGLRAQAAPRRPNVVLIITDDVGYGDFGRPFLFNVRTDLGERTNLIRSHSELARRLRSLLDKWQNDVDAEAKSSHS